MLMHIKLIYTSSYIDWVFQGSYNYGLKFQVMINVHKGNEIVYAAEPHLSEPIFLEMELSIIILWYKSPLRTRAFQPSRKFVGLQEYKIIQPV